MIQVASMSIIFYFIQLLMLFASSSKFSLHDHVLDFSYN